MFPWTACLSDMFVACNLYIIYFVFTFGHNGMYRAFLLGQWRFFSHMRFSDVCFHTDIHIPTYTHTCVNMQLHMLLAHCFFFSRDVPSAFVRSTAQWMAKKSSKWHRHRADGGCNIFLVGMHVSSGLPSNMPPKFILLLFWIFLAHHTLGPRRSTFSWMRSEGSRFIWGCGGEAVFTESFACVRNRPEPSATVRNRLRECDKLSTVASASGLVLIVCQVDSRRRSHIGVCRGGVCEMDLWRRSYIGVCRGGVCESDLCQRSHFGVCSGAVRVSDPCQRNSIGVCRGGVCVIEFRRRSYMGVCRGGVCVSDRCRCRYFGVCGGCVCETDLWRRSFIGVCRGGVCVSELCHRSDSGVCRGGVCVSDLCCRSYIGVCGGGVCVSELCRRNYFGVCSGGVCVSELCRRSYLDVCSGGVCVSDLCRLSCKKCQVRVS